MQQNPSTTSSGSPSVATRLACALLGGGLAYLTASSFVTGGLVLLITAAIALLALAIPQALLVPIALVGVPIWNTGKYLSGEAYRGFARGIVNFPLGLAAAGAAALGTGYGLGWALSVSLLIWIPASVAAAAAAFFILEPAFFLYILKPTCEGLEKLFKRTYEWAKTYGKPFFQGVVDVAKKLPGSERLWSYASDEEKGAQWVTPVSCFISGFGTIAVAWTLTVLLFNAMLPLVGGFTLPLIGVAISGVTLNIICGFASGVLAIALLGIAIQLLETSRLPASAIAISGAATYFSWPLLARNGFGVLVTTGLAVVTFTLFLAYVYPALHALFKSGFVKTILEGVKQLCKTTYKDDNKEYEKYFGQLCVIVGSFVSAGLTAWGLAYLGVFPIVVIVLASLVAAIFTYLSAGKGWADFDSVAGAFGFVTFALGFAAWHYLSDGVSGWVFWPLLAVGALLNFTVVLTLLYVGFRKLTISKSKAVGEKLEAWQQAAYAKAKVWADWYNKKFLEPTFDERDPYDKDNPKRPEITSYAKGFVHLANLAVIAVGVWQAWPLLGGFWILPAWLVISSLVLLAVLIYIILGQLLRENGIPGFAIALGLVAFAHGTWSLYSVRPDEWWLDAIVSFCFTFVLCFIALPVAYVAFKFVTSRVLTPLGPVLDRIHQFAWRQFEIVWKVLKAIGRWINTNILGWFFVLVASVWNGIRETWERLTGGKKSS